MKKALLFFMTLSVIGLPTAFGEKELQADIFQFENEKKVIAQVVEQRSESAMLQMGKVPGGQQFVDDVKALQETFDLNTEIFPGGLMASFSGFASGNVLHSFFGFFHLGETGRITSVDWGQHAKGKVLQSGLNFLEFENASTFPLPCGNLWQDFTTGQEITLQCKGFLLPGATGMFKFESPSSTVQNALHNFLVNLK